MEASKRIRICLSYDGTSFYGWQKQPHVKETVQGILEEKISKIFNLPVSVVGSGRTDRGVHALNQWAHFNLPEEADTAELRYKLNRMTPESIWIKSMELAPSEFHAQISALSKCYKYRIYPGKEQNPFVQPQAWVFGHDLNLKKLNEFSQVVLGKHDFTSFQSQGTPVSSPIRKIEISRWIEKESGILEYQIKGSGFLKQMVRNLVGTMLKLEQFQSSREDFQAILKAKDRGLAAAPAPPQGLFLASVQYPGELDNKCRKL